LNRLKTGIQKGPTLEYNSTEPCRDFHTINYVLRVLAAPDIPLTRPWSLPLAPSPTYRLYSLATSSAGEELAVDKQADETGNDDENDTEHDDDTCFARCPAPALDELVHGGLSVATDEREI